MATNARAGHALGIAYGDGAAVNVHLLGRDADPLHASERLAGEGLVQFPQIDVVGLEAVALQLARYGEDGTDAHLARLAAANRKAAENTEWRQTLAGGDGGFRQQAGNRAVGELRGVAGGDGFTFLDLHAAISTGLRAVRPS